MPARRLSTGEGLAVIAAVLILAAVVLVVARGRGAYIEPSRVECMNNVRNIVGLLESAPRPKQGGADLILYLVTKGELDRRPEHLEILFCPGDGRESLTNAGGPRAYATLALGTPNGHLTSYAGRALLDKRYALPPSSVGAVLIADDSEEHHDGKGIVVGFTGGSVRWRDKLDDYGFRGASFGVGPGSRIEELRCLKID